MADDGLFFRAIARVHPRYQTPSAAIVLTGFLGIGFVLIRTFEQLADGVRLPDHPLRGAGLLLVDPPAQVRSDANVTLARIDDLSGGDHV